MLEEQFPSVWNDGIGAFGYWWTVSVPNAAVISVLIAVLVGVSVRRLMSIFQTLFYVFVTERRSKTLVDDQANVLTANNSSASGLLLSLSSLIFTNSLLAFKSNTVKVCFVLIPIIFAIHGALIYAVG